MLRLKGKMTARQHQTPSHAHQVFYMNPRLCVNVKCVQGALDQSEGFIMQ